MSRPGAAAATGAGSRPSTPPAVWTRPDDYDTLARGFQAANAALLARHAPAGGTALDAGCGTGLLAGALLARGASHVTAFDPSPSMAEAARRRLPASRATVTVAALEDFRTDQRFDVVASSAMLTWLYPHMPEALARLGRLARAGGHVLVATAGRTESSDAYDIAQERLRALAGLPVPPVPFFLRRSDASTFLAAADEGGLGVEEVFVVEREQEMDPVAWVRWLVASGAPWRPDAPHPQEEVERRLVAAVGHEPVRVRHWTLVAVCRAGAAG